MNKKPIAPYAGPLWPLGSMVIIERPHLFSGYVGLVDGRDEKMGTHRVAVTVQNGHTFHTEATGDLLTKI